VKQSRVLAARGVLTLRIDFSGRGESYGSAAAASIEAMIADANAALRWLRVQAPSPTPLAVLGICSGCKVAFATAAAAADDIAALILWSAESMGSLRSQATGRRKMFTNLKAYLVKLRRAETWAKLLRGQVRTDMVRKALVRQEQRSAEEAVREDEILCKFHTFGGEMLFVFGGSDPDAKGSSAAYTNYCRRHRLRQRTHTVAHAGHSYYALDWEEEVIAKSTDFVQEVMAIQNGQSGGGTDG